MIAQGLQQGVIDDVYAKLFSERDFKLENLKPELLKTARAQMTEEIERQKMNDLITANVHNVEDVDWTERVWSKEWRSQAPEMRAFEKIFGERSFDLNDLSEDAKAKECATWRAEVVRETAERELSEQSFSFEQSDSMSRLLFGDEQNLGLRQIAEDHFRVVTESDITAFRNGFERNDDDRGR